MAGRLEIAPITTDLRDFPYKQDYTAEAINFLSFNVPVTVATTPVEGILVGGTGGSRLRVLALHLATDRTTVFDGTIEDTSAGTDRIDLNALVNGAPIVLPYSDTGWFETAAGEGLDFRLVTVATVSIIGNMVYTLII